MIPEEDRPAGWLRGYGGIEADIRQMREFADRLQAEVSGTTRHTCRYIADDMRPPSPTRPTRSSSWSSSSRRTTKPSRRPSDAGVGHGARHRPAGRRRRPDRHPLRLRTRSPPPGWPTSNAPSPARPPCHPRRRCPAAPDPTAPENRAGWCCRDRAGQRPDLRPHRLAADGRAQHVGVPAGPGDRRALEAGRRLAQGLRPRPDPPEPPPRIPARARRGVAAGDKRRRPGVHRRTGPAHRQGAAHPRRGRRELRRAGRRHPRHRQRPGRAEPLYEEYANKLQQKQAYEATIADPKAVAGSRLPDSRR